MAHSAVAVDGAMFLYAVKEKNDHEWLLICLKVFNVGLFVHRHEKLFGQFCVNAYLCTAFTK